MLLTFELVLVLLLVLGIGVWGLVSGVRMSRRQRRAVVNPQVVSALAQPYRELMGEAVAIYRDVEKQSAQAPKTLQRELHEMSLRVQRLVARALPRAQHGTSLAAFLLKLDKAEPQYVQTQAAANEVQQELRQFVDTLKTLRGKVYQVLTDASRLSADQQLSRDLEDALFEINALEEAFAETEL